MSLTRHHAIVVSGSEGAVLDALRVARRLALCVVAAPAPQANGYCSFAVLPDGSNEGWPASDACDAHRAELKRWMEIDGEVEWVEVAFGGDGGTPEVTGHDGAQWRRRAGDVTERLRGRGIALGGLGTKEGT